MRAFDHAGIHLRIEMDVDLRMEFDEISHIPKIALMIRTEDGAHLDAAAQTGALLVKIDLMPAHRGTDSGVDACRTGANDHDAFRSVGLRGLLMIELSSKARIHAAILEGLPLGNNVIEASAAHNALSYLFESILHDLSRKRRVGDAVAQAGDHIELSCRKGFFHFDGIGIAIALSHRLGGDGLDLL